MSKAYRSLECQAKDLLKESLKSGHVFDGSHCACDFLIEQLGVKSHRVTPGKASAWLRQARYELADEHISVTNPTPGNGFRHEAYISAEDRIAARKVLKKHLRTRVGSLSRQMNSDVAQKDVSPQEERDQKVLEAVGILIETVN